MEEWSLILLNKRNFSVYKFHRDSHSTPSLNDRFYTDLKLCFVLDGSVTWEIENRIYKVETGDVVFLNIGQRRRFLSYGEKGLTLCTFNFARSAFSQPRHALFFQEMAGKNPVLSSPLGGILKEILEFWDAHDPLRYEWATAKFTEFFIRGEQLTHFAPKAVSKRDLEILEKMDEIESAVLKGAGLREISAGAGLSESAFSRRFAAVMGMQFKQYAMEKKIQRSLELLEKTDMKTIDIAAECGFQSISGFYDTFRKLLGTTPNKIRSDSK